MSIPLTRRSVLAAGAWAVPAVAAVAAAPASTSSAVRGWTVTTSPAWAYPDEVVAVRVTSPDDDGAPLGGRPVVLALGDPGQGVIDQPTGLTDATGVYETTLRVRGDAAAGGGTLSVAAASGTASCAFEVRAPRASTHDSSGATTRVIALAHGSQDAVAAVENRQFAHSDLQPTGRYVFAGDALDVVVAADAPAGMSLVIGVRGPWRAFNAGQQQDLSVIALSPGAQSITAPQDGLVFVRNGSTERSGALTISGGAPHPVWVKDQTKPDEFAAQLAAWAAAPAVTLVGERAFADVQRRVIDDLASRGVAWDSADVVLRLDRVVAYTCDVYGLSRAAVGVARKYPGRVYFGGPDSGGGWAFATSQWVCFQVDTGASETLLTDTDSWGIWHEVGHTFQAPAYRWSGLMEVTVNISALALQNRLTGQNRLDDEADRKDRAAQYLARPLDERDHAQLTADDPFLGLYLFEQLRRSFGDSFYPALNQEYRVRRIRGLSMPEPDQDKKDLFAEIASRVADRDLGPFFTEWGVPLSASVLSSLSAYPALQNPIWAAVDSHDAVVERSVGYDLPVGSLSLVDGTIDLGEHDGSSGRVTGLSTLGGATSAVVAAESTAKDVGTDGRVTVVLQSADGTLEALWRPAPVSVTSGLQFVGIMDWLAGWVGISRDGTHLTATSTGIRPHDYYFQGRLYYELTLTDADGAELVSVSVNGDETHDKVVTALDGFPVADGFALVVNAAEVDRVRVYRDSVRVDAVTTRPQTLAIRGGRFVV
ncbi:M60 family metallopeptidase [Microbacterium sp. KSW2-21]|uniref:M60 family metallopeptidase n=1 Tax=Microbacterium algihabitans TaxID=3075992 RepID=A0ABU3RQT9_9MICO|nr:M60 family metallopeptidase [Microbacterium sp. KSW2-21]MDU0325277.1 M60 family metallopeptidase [Microbacterium sp. KSW2-21]